MAVLIFSFFVLGEGSVGACQNLAVKKNMSIFRN